MDIEIRKLTPDLTNDYLHFFDTEKHSDNIDEHKCYCVCWCSDDHRSDNVDMSSAEKRRELAAHYVNNGLIKGYLAYQDDRVVGWCNANSKPECFNCISWLRFMSGVSKSESSKDIKVKSILCFTVAPSMRRKGVATKLLERVCIDAAKEGYGFVESYPKKNFKQMDNFEGHLEMYKNCGFFVHEQLDDFVVMRKQL